jgi:photosystem II stability/assembly factor-like uncharacterized protein
MDDGDFPGGRARRALPVMAAALAALVVLSFMYLRPSAPRPAVTLHVVSVPKLDQQLWPAFDFVTPSLGWAVIVVSGTSEAHVYRTTDGAKHWHGQFVTRLVDPQLPSIEFFDREHGFFFSGELYRTVDGGEHWERISVPDASADFTFASPLRGWVVTYDLQSTSQLYSTVDGGLTWQHLGAWLGPPALQAGFGGGAPFVFRADGEGWAGASGSAPTLYSTHDGGRTWTSVELPVPQIGRPIPSPPPGKGSRAGYTTTARLVPGGGVVALVLDYFGDPTMYTSDARGRTWTLAALPPAPAQFWDMSFVDAKHWWASRWDVLFKTTDAGLTWHEVRTSAPDYLFFWSFDVAHVIDARHAWLEIRSPAAGPSGLAMTADAGANWDAANVPQPA